MSTLTCINKKTPPCDVAEGKDKKLNEEKVQLAPFQRFDLACCSLCAQGREMACMALSSITPLISSIRQQVQEPPKVIMSLSTVVGGRPLGRRSEADLSPSLRRRKDVETLTS